MDASDELIVSPLGVRGQERLARLRASIQQRFGGDNRTPTTANAAATALPPRAMIRQRIEQASHMTVDEIFFREFGNPEQLAALDCELVRAEPLLATSQGHVRGPSTAALSAPVRNSVFSSRMEAARMATTSAAEVTHALNRSHAAFDHHHHQYFGQRAASAQPERLPGAYVSQLQRPSQITTPKKKSLKRLRSADEPTPPPAQKPRLLSDVTSTFNNRSFRNVGHSRGTSSSASLSNSPVRKAPGVSARASLLQQPSPSKFRAPATTNATRLFGPRPSFR